MERDTEQVYLRLCLFFVRRPAWRSLLLTQYAGRAASRGKASSARLGNIYRFAERMKPVKRKKIGSLLSVLVLFFLRAVPAYAMEAPGDGEPGWYYEQKKHYWYYYNEDKARHTGWLKYNNEWYWFDSTGRMEDNGNAVIDGIPYYFFINGHMAWNQYVGMKFYNADGQHQQEHDVRIIGRMSPENVDRDLFSDYLYDIPRSWIARFIDEGWEFMFYKQKEYFAAPNTSQGIYYVHHSVDTHYKKLKFTDVEDVQQAFGEYVGYAAGCYEEGNSWMKVLWEEEPALKDILELPDYYANDDKFYFGRLFCAYLDSQDREKIILSSRKTCEVMEEILSCNDDEKTKERLKKKAEAEWEDAKRRAERILQEEGYGPGRKPPETKKEE